MNSCFWFIKLRFVHFFLLAAPGRCETDFRFGGQRRGLRRDAAVALDPKNLMVKIPWWKWRENFRLRSGKKHFYGNQGTGRKKTWAAKLTYVEKDIRREISLVFFRKNVGSSFHVGSILVDFDVECMQWIWWIWWIWIRHARECPGGFQHKSWRLHHDEIILAVAQEERDSLGSSRVHFCRCVRLVSGAGTSCTWNEMMWTTCFSTFGPSIQEDCGISTYFRKPREPSWYVCISGLSETVLYSTLQSADLRNPCKPYLSKTSKMMLQLIPPHVLFIYSSFVLLHLGGSFTSTESRHCRCQIIVLQGHDATNRTRLIASGEPREIGNRQGRFWNSSLTILLFDSLSR